MTAVVRLSPAARLVLTTLLEHPERETYGQELIKATGKGHGTVYPMLARLEAHGWISARWEDYEPDVARRPPRLYCKLTADGAIRAREVLTRRRRR
ncbi:PadR family transcriptional regulator [Streptosporangium roseum]|uniref:PadR family transcriptional regulator n=1 Tax=Streptosporangium roseum TaxID=2001 RepID=UPI003329C3E4